MDERMHRLLARTPGSSRTLLVLSFAPCDRSHRRSRCGRIHLCLPAETSPGTWVVLWLAHSSLRPRSSLSQFQLVEDYPNATGGHTHNKAVGVGYRNDNTTGVAKGDEPETLYMVTSGQHYNEGCCFDCEPPPWAAPPARHVRSRSCGSVPDRAFLHALCVHSPLRTRSPPRPLAVLYILCTRVCCVVARLFPQTATPKASLATRETAPWKRSRSPTIGAGPCMAPTTVLAPGPGSGVTWSRASS